MAAIAYFFHMIEASSQWRPNDDNPIAGQIIRALSHFPLEEVVGA